VAQLAAARPATLVLDLGRRYTLSVLNVGLACCAVEAMVASLQCSAPAGSVPYAGEDRCVDVLVVSGTVTDKLAPLVRGLYDALPAPVVVSFGACANSGGPYWDSYCVQQGVDRVVPVDVWVPGCPPRPQALLAALRELGPDGSGPPPRRRLDVDPVRPARGQPGPQDLRARPA
jgi:NADH-quinone oxidoreductase subunit B